MTEFEGGGGQSSTVRWVIGAIIAPLGTLLVYVVFICAINFNREETLPPSAQLWFLKLQFHQWFSPLTLFVAYAGEVVVWIPVHFYLQRHRLTSLRIYVVAGVLSLIVLFAVPWFIVGGRMGVLMAIGAMLPIGMIWSTIFWLIARPDRNAPSI